jgi:hypothetical protein
MVVFAMILCSLGWPLGRLLIAGFFALIVAAFLAPGPADTWPGHWWAFVGLLTVVFYSLVTSAVRRA